MAAYEAWTVEWDMPTLVLDPFTRDVGDGWGEVRAGLVWAVVSGTPADHGVTGSRARHQMATRNLNYIDLIDLGTSYDVLDLLLPIRPGVVATGADFRVAIEARSSNSSNDWARWDIEFRTSGELAARHRRQIGGVQSNYAYVTLPFTYSAPDVVWSRFLLSGNDMYGKAWLNDFGDEPESWSAIELGGAAGVPAGTQAGVRSFINSANTNDLPVRVEFDSFQVAVPERYVDVTSYVDTAKEPFSTTSGDTPEASADTGGAVLPFVNPDQRFTPGNIRSPYHPNIRPGSRIRVRETILDQVFARLTGYVQYPEIAAWTQSTGEQPRDQQIGIPVVDRVAWIAQGRRMVSTLAEYIMYNAGPSLVAYWPLGESEGPDVNAAVGAPWTLTQKKGVIGSGNAPDSDPASITYGSAGIAPADDLSSIEFAPSIQTNLVNEYATFFTLIGTRPTPVTLSTGQVLTIVCWTRASEVLDPSLGADLIFLKSSADDANSARIQILGDTISAQAVWAGDWDGSVSGPPVTKDQPIPVAFRVGFDPDVVELWVRGEVYTDTMTVTTATTAVFDQLEIGGNTTFFGGYPGWVNHVQVYIGAEDDWTHDDFLAQYEMGLAGLERQTTGERIRTVLQYAGVDPADLGRIDQGASLMQRAALAGMNPIDAVTAAVETEQGEFYADGDGQPVFADRVRLYNI